MTRLFVTATGTGIGKTFVTAALATAAQRRGLAVLALKPVASGCDPLRLEGSDSALLLAAQGLPAEAIDRISPWRFEAPLSPDMAAAREGRPIDFAALIAWSQAALCGCEEVILIEGIGGVMVPLDDSHTVLDWMAALGIPALLIAGSYLGTLSHTLSALAALKRAAVPVRALVLDETPDSSVPLGDTAETLARFAAGVPVLMLSRGEDPVSRLAPLLDP